jgi:phenylalanyl-tRNA synthetase beta chain
VREFEFSSAPILFEIDLDAALVEQRQDFSEPSKFPQVRRDLAFVVDDSVSYAEVRRRVFQAASSALRDVVLFDIYRGAGIEVGRKSMALGLILQDKDRTLTDEETDSIVTAVRSSLSEGLQASFRG